MRERSLEEFESIFERASIPVLDIEPVRLARVSAVLEGHPLDASILSLASYLKAGFGAEVLLHWSKQVDADEVSFAILKEDWNRYQLHDGSELRLRLVVSDILRIPNEYDADGNPVYVVKSKNFTTVTSPDELKGPS